MNSPLVSILVPVYNGERYLRECLDSILAQDYPDTEILISDDHSTDGSAALLKDFAARDPRIRWWKNAQNLGLVENWNHLLREARGEYIKFVFQDDKLLSPTAVSQMARALTEHSGVALVASATYVIDESSQILKARDFFRPGVRDGRRIVVRCLERNGNLIGEPSAVMFRHAAARTGFDPQYRQMVDLEFFLRLLEKGDFCYLPQKLAAFRRHSDQETAKNNRNGVEVGEHVLLTQTWLAKPWVGSRRHTRREMQFNLIRSCRKTNTAESLALKVELMFRLGRGWYVVYWLKRKISQPLKKLPCQIVPLLRMTSATKFKLKSKFL